MYFEDLEKICGEEVEPFQRKGKLGIVDELKKIVMEASLPLRVEEVQPVGGGELGTEVRREKGIDVVVFLEKSTKWPVEKAAFEAAKGLFLIEIAEYLERRQVESLLSTEGFLDVLYRDTAFRLWLCSRQETCDDEGRLCLEHAGRLAVFFRCIARRFGLYRKASSVAKLFFSSKMVLGGGLSDELADCLVSFVLLEKAPKTLNEFLSEFLSTVSGLTREKLQTVLSRCQKEAPVLSPAFSCPKHFSVEETALECVREEAAAVLLGAEKSERCFCGSVGVFSPPKKASFVFTPSKEILDGVFSALGGRKGAIERTVSGFGLCEYLAGHLRRKYGNSAVFLCDVRSGRFGIVPTKSTPRMFSELSLLGTTQGDGSE